jgi:hypothetical protein
MAWEMRSVHPLVEMDIESWTGPFSDAERRAAIAGLEAGGVLFFPRLGFPLDEAESGLAGASHEPVSRKNITFDPRTGRAHGAELADSEAGTVKMLLDRYGATVARWFDDLFPAYVGAVERARATFRPAEISGRVYSPRKDDRRLHVDAFPSRPTSGRRILRIFTNINTFGEARLWNVGEPFEIFAAKFLPKSRGLFPFESHVLSMLGITKGRRTAYDHLMIELHDRAKLDDAYQSAAPHVQISFPPGSTWLCFTDQVLHAALSGRGVLEQTLLIDPARQAEPERAPLRVLERLAGRALV